MTKMEGISDLHADVRVPFQDKNKPEYADMPNRHPDVGTYGERSVLARLHEFGVTDEDLHTAGVGDLREMTEDQYERLLGEAVRQQFTLLFANAFDHWDEKPGSQQWDSIRKTSEMVHRWKSQWGIDLILRGEDLKKDRPAAMLTLEGLHLLEDMEQPTQEDVDRVLTEVYSVGIRSVILQYNIPTRLAGWDDGLTELGVHAVSGLLNRGMLVDLAHARPATRADILRMAEDAGRGEQILYSHGASALEVAKDPDYGHPLEVQRGLTDEEIKKIMSLGGIIGLSVTRPFVQSPLHLAQTFDRLAQFEHGPKSLAIGTDFGGVPPQLSVGMLSPSEVALKLGDLLSERFGATDAHVRAILRDNALNWIQKLRA